jgi:hypothetical protein
MCEAAKSPFGKIPRLFRACNEPSTNFRAVAMDPVLDSLRQNTLVRLRPFSQSDHSSRVQAEKALSSLDT